MTTICLCYVTVCLNNRYDVDAPTAAEFQVSRLPEDVGRHLALQRTRAVESASFLRPIPFVPRVSGAT
jgi:hypothetical protein